MMITCEQIRAGRALVRLEQADLARRAQVSLVTVRRIEAAGGVPRVAPATFDSVRRVLEDAGVEFIPYGVKRRFDAADKATLLRDLQAISQRCADRHRGEDAMTEADLYDGDGLPA
jgi:hypothetical protein